MILSEEYLMIPGKKYAVEVQCATTRRLTAMEWLVVNCTLKFRNSSKPKIWGVRTVFENVFQLTNSEILVKPCITSLLNEKAITLDVPINYNYSQLTFSQIKLTDKGLRMAKDGLFPGEIKTLSLDIYFNPMTGKMNQFISGKEKVSNLVEFGTQSDYSYEFPEKKVVDALQKGLVGNRKFIASEQRIESINCVSSVDWNDVIKMEISVDGEGNVTTNPVVQEENVKPLIKNLFLSKEIGTDQLDDLLWLEEEKPEKIYGSGKSLIRELGNVCKNGIYIGINNWMYSAYSYYKSFFEERTLFVWNSKEFSINCDRNSFVVMIPNTFPIGGCEAINEKNQSVSFAKNTYNYDGYDLTVPVAFVDERIRLGEKTLSDWLEKTIFDNVSQDVRFLSLLSLPIFDLDKDVLKDACAEIWENASVDKIISDIKCLKELCDKMGTDMIPLEGYIFELWNKIKDLTKTDALEAISVIINSGCVASGSGSHKFLIKNVLDEFGSPKSYKELVGLLDAIGINDHDDALSNDEFVSSLYSYELIVDFLKSILEKSFSPINELFELDALFNSYYHSINQLELLISGFSAFEEMNSKSIIDSLEKCPDIALAQSYVAGIESKNAELLKWQVNVFNVMKTLNEKKAIAFFDNISCIKKSVDRMTGTEEQVCDTEDEEKNITVPKKIMKKMYILDTCALINNPDILLMFDEEDYVRIPATVVDELGQIKDRRNRRFGDDPYVPQIARRLAKDIYYKYLKLFNFSNRLRLVIENPDPDILPIGLDKGVHDNLILSVALKYSNWDTYIISDDVQFRLMSNSQRIAALTGQEFIESHQIYKKSMDQWMDSYKKHGGNLQEDSTDSLKTTADELKDAVKMTDEAVHELELGHFNSPGVDDLPIRELKKVLSSELTEQVLSLMQKNGIKTVGQFRMLTPEKIDGFKAKGQQIILIRNIKRALAKYAELVI